MRHRVALLFGLAVLWLALSGHYEALMLGFGTASCLFVFWICARLKLITAEAVPIGLLLRLPVYTVWLLGQIARSNLDIGWRLLAPKRFIRPTLVAFETRQHSDLGRAILANSITLTPGTATVGMENGRAVIHSLTRVQDSDIRDGLMDQRVRWLVGKAH